MSQTLLLPHDAHAGWQGDTAYADCRDCDWKEVFYVTKYPTVLWAWNEAARARDLHHDTHTKETE